MIQRIVLFKLTDDHATDEGRREVIEYTKKTFQNIPGIERLSVGAPADDAAKQSWDVAIVVELADLDAVEKYRVHPEHQKYLKEFLEPRAVFKKVWNFEI